MFSITHPRYIFPKVFCKLINYDPFARHYDFTKESSIVLIGLDFLKDTGQLNCEVGLQNNWNNPEYYASLICS